MNVFTVSFFGHRVLSRPLLVEKALEEVVRNILLKHEYVEFLVGRDGEFDMLAASVVRRCKRRIRDDNSTLVLVLPYMTSQFQKNEVAFLDYYDEAELSPFSDSAHFKAAHQLRNRHMVDRSELVVFCVERKSGGAYQTLCYAQREGREYVNIASV